MEDSVPKPADIHLYMAYHVTQSYCVLIYQLSCDAMLNYGIIERAEDVIMLTCVYAVLTVAAWTHSTRLQDILTDIMLDSLTTMLFLHRLCMKHFYYSKIFLKNQLALAL